MSTDSNVARPARALVRSIFVWMTLISVPVTTACGVLAGSKTACDGLVYKEFGLTRAEYLPCAGEMIAALDRIEPQVEAMMSGDQRARGEAEETLRELERLVKKAGGRNMGMEQWDDRGLTKLNHQIWTVAEQYEACFRFGEFRVSPRVAKENLAQMREYIEASKMQCKAPGRSAREASNAYHYMR